MPQRNSAPAPKKRELNSSYKVDRDDSASEPYSDELLSGDESPEILETGFDGDEDVEILDEEEEEESFEDEEGERSSTKNGEGEVVESSDEEVEDEEGEESGAAIQRRIASVSFGALAKAQTSLDAAGGDGIGKRKRGFDGKGDEAEDKLRALRDRLRELQQGKTGRGTTKGAEKGLLRNLSGGVGSKPRPGRHQDDNTEDEEDDDDTSDSDSSTISKPHTKQHQRTSKHAPQQLTSKRQVTRKREVIDVPKAKIRDPRFDPLTGPMSQEKHSKNYNFISEYQTSEIQKLKALLKDRATSRKMSASEKEDLKREILVLESKQKSEADKLRTQNVVREHRRKEKEAVAQGKKPFYLKDKEIKRRSLVSKFEGMKDSERTRAVERRERKLGQREKRGMPGERRVRG